MKYFDYVEPKTITEACQFLNQHEEAKILAGGVSLLVLLKNHLLSPSHLVNLKTIPGLGKVEWKESEGMSIGALNRHRDVLSSPLIQKHFPILNQAASRIASPPIRNAGTIGGNIAHAEPSADFPPALIALRATLRLVSTTGERKIPVEQFFTDYYENVLARGEILTEIQIPPLSRRSAGIYLKLDKTTNSMAIVGVAAVLSLDEKGICTYAGMGLGGVSSVPLRVEKITEFLIGEKIGETHVERAAREAQSLCRPISNVHASAEYRKEMVYVLARKALREALKGVSAM